MNTLAATIPDEDIPRARVALLLKHFSAIKDDREPWLVVYPLKEVLLLVVCRIASCDDFDDIVPWGEHHIDFLRRICEFHHGTPCERWVRALFNRSTPSCLAVVSIVGSQRSGRTATSSSLLMAKPRAEPTTNA